jgi:hypothetical protein
MTFGISLLSDKWKHHRQEAQRQTHFMPRSTSSARQFYFLANLSAIFMTFFENQKEKIGKTPIFPRNYLISK